MRMWKFKVCSKCNKSLPENQFSKDKRLKSGLRASCKKCDYERDKIYKHTPRGRKAHNKAKRNYARRNPDYWLNLVDEQRKKYPERFFAYNEVQKAINSGRLEKKPCGVCGSENSQAHHEDYSKPLDVIWLCPLHHKEVHCEKLDG